MKNLAITLLLLLGMIVGSAYAFDHWDGYHFDAPSHNKETHEGHHAYDCHN